MRCVILSRKANLYATKRLAEEGRKLGLKVTVMDTLRISVLVDSDVMKLMHKHTEIKHPNIVIPRIGASITAFGGCVMFQMEKMGIPMLNSSMGMFNSRDKFRCGQILAANGIATPKTLMLRRPVQKDLTEKDPAARRDIYKHRIATAIELLGGPPVVFKLNKGTQGVGVILAKDLNEIYAQVDMLWKRREDFIIQEFIKESKGIDIRALVVGNKVVAAMKRESKTGDFRSNTHQGGEVSKYNISTQESMVAIRAAELVGLNVAGVDLLIADNGPKVIEVNSSPGFEGLEKATKHNVAKDIMNLAKAMRVNPVKNGKLITTIENDNIPSITQ